MQHFRYLDKVALGILSMTLSGLYLICRGDNVVATSIYIFVLKVHQLSEPIAPENLLFPRI